jgi:hypothetical protein
MDTILRIVIKNCNGYLQIELLQYSYYIHYSTSKKKLDIYILFIRFWIPL